MFDDLFGGLFDFNGDGQTDFAEEMLGLAIIDDMEKTDGKESGYTPCVITDDDLNSEDFLSDDSEDKKEERRSEIELEKRDPAMYEQTLAHLIAETKRGRLFGEWNDYGRLLDY